jgi:hypothetical protein
LFVFSLTLSPLVVLAAVVVVPAAAAVVIDLCLPLFHIYYASRTSLIFLLLLIARSISQIF